MQLKRVTIRNFRSLRAVDFYPREKNLLVGENNAGKSSLLEALNFCLGGDGQRAAGEVGAYDFFQGKFVESDGTPRVVAVEVVIGSLEAESRATFREMLEIWDAEKREVLEVAEAAGRIESDSKEWCVRIRFEARYDSEAQDITVRRYYPKFGESETDINYREVRTSDRRAIGFFFVPCVRHADQGFNLGRFSLLGTLLRAHDVGLTELLSKVRERLGDDEVLKSLRENARYQTAMKPVKEQLRALLHDQAPGGLELDLRVADVSGRELLNAIQILFKPAGGLDLPMALQGHGTQQAALLGLYLALASRRGLRILAVEEPETGLHPGLARAMATRLIGAKAQLFATTHSPVVCQRFQPENVFVLVREGHGESAKHEFISMIPPLPVTPPATNAEDLRRTALKWLGEQPLDFVAVTFARTVLVVEGKTEQQWLHHLLQRACSDRKDCAGLLDADSLGIAIARADNHGDTDKVALLWKRHFHKRAIILLDGDVSEADRKAKLERCDLLVSLPETWAIEKLFLAGIPDGELVEFATAVGFEVAPGTEPKRGELAKHIKDAKGNSHLNTILKWKGYVPARAVGHLVAILNRFASGETFPEGKELRLETERATDRGNR